MSHSMEAQLYQEELDRIADLIIAGEYEDKEELKEILNEFGFYWY